MQSNRRLRVFARPNGSGKSTLFEEFKKTYNPGYFINADELQKLLASSGLIDLKAMGLNASEENLIAFKKTSEAKSLINKSNSEGYKIDIEVRENFIVDRSKLTNSYEASFVASFIRRLLILSNKSFAFETVMSHSSKVAEIKKAQQKGYKTYLYFVCTNSPEINIDRVANRVDKGGHNVDENRIRSRYTDTLKNLYAAIKYSNRAYLFDNSGKQITLIAEIFGGFMQLKTNKLPQLFYNYVLPNYQTE